MSAERGRYATVASLSDSSEVLDDEDSFDGDLNESDPLLTDMAPEDKYSCVYLIFYLFGLGGLLPWNFFITARDYWMYKLGDFNTTMPESTIAPLVTATETVSNSTVLADYNSSSTTQPNVGPQVTTLQSLFMNSLAVCAMLPNVIFQFLNTLLQKRINQHVRILTTLTLMIILFIITEILVKVDTSTWQNTFFTVTLVTIVVLNSCSAIFQSSGFGMAARFPLRYCGAVMAGQGIGGVFAAVAMIISLACSSNPTDSAFIFFLTAIASLFITIICYLLLIKLTFYKYFTASLRNRNSSQNEDFKLDSPINGDAEDEKFLPPEPINGDVEVRHNSLSKTATSSSDERIEYSESSVPLMHIAKKIWLHMFCIVYVFTITLACFPAVTASIKSLSSGNDWTDIYFTPVCCFLLFNLADWVGRTSATYIHIPSPNSKVSLLILVLARSVFPFLFALCNYQPRNYLPVVFKQDVFFIIFMILFAVSNGHLSTLSMQYGPKQVEEEHSATAGSMLAFMISVGLLAGAGSSFLITSLI